MMPSVKMLVGRGPMEVRTLRWSVVDDEMTREKLVER